MFRSSARVFERSCAIFSALRPNVALILCNLRLIVHAVHALGLVVGAHVALICANVPSSLRHAAAVHVARGLVLLNASPVIANIRSVFPRLRASALDQVLLVILNLVTIFPNRFVVALLLLAVGLNVGLNRSPTCDS
jgi:hypothetical protein